MKIEAMNNVLNNNVIAIITEKSFVVIERTNWSPSPGTPKIFSIVNVPVKILANIGTRIVTTGISAFRSACPNNTLAVEFPFARASNI